MNVGIIYFVLFYLLLRFTTQQKQKLAILWFYRMKQFMR